MLPIPICVPDRVKEMVYLLPGQKPAQKKDLTIEHSGESSLMVPHGVCSNNRERKCDRLQRFHRKPQNENLRFCTEWGCRCIFECNLLVFMKEYRITLNSLLAKQ